MQVFFVTASAVTSINSALQRTTVVNGSTPDAAIGNEETMDKLSITLLQQIFDIHIPSELQSQSEHKRQRHKQRQQRLKQLQGAEHDSDSDVQDLEDHGIHTTLGMAAALVATLNSSNHSNNAELPAPPCDTPITSIPLPKVSKKSDGRKKSTDSNSGLSSVADTVVAPECTDDLLALLRLPLVSKQDVIKLLQQSIDEQHQQGVHSSSDDSSSVATATTEQQSSSSSSSSTDGTQTSVHDDASANERAGSAATADSSAQQQKQQQQQQRRAVKVQLFPTDAISTLLTAIERGEGKGRLHMPMLCDEQWYDGSITNSSSNSAFNSTNSGPAATANSMYSSNAYDADTSVHGGSSHSSSTKDAAKSRHPKLSTLLSKRR
jgi:hypothetical protein